MHSIAAIEGLVWGIQYKPGWSVRIGEMGDGAFLQWQFFAADADDPASEPVVQAGRKWYISRHSTVSEIVQTALMAAIAAEEHEAREWFRWKGVRPFAPHFDVEALAELDRTAAHDVRSEITATV